MSTTTDLDSNDFAGRSRFTAAITHRWCWAYDVPPHDQDDAIQEANLAVIKALPRYDPSRPLKPFLATVIRRRLSSWLYQQRRCSGQPKRRPWLAERVARADHSTVLDCLALKDVAACYLQQAEQVLLQQMLAGKPVEEIAQERGCTKGYIYDLQRRLIRRLRSILTTH